MATPDVEYDIGLDTSKFEKERKKLDNQFRKMEISSDNFGKSAVQSLSTLALGAGGAVVAYKALTFAISQVTEGVQKFNAQAKAEATLEQTLKATGYAAGLTSTEIKNMASELQGLTTYGDEAIISSANLLLTFKNVGEDVFPQAQKAILDVSAAMGQDLKTSSIQVGKALNDPITGMTAMSRVGITFTDTQKELVKGFVETNQLAEAQAVILQELESQFGGVAEAQAKTFEGINTQIDNYIGDIQEKIGEGFAGEMTKPLQELLDSLVAASPELQDLAVSFGKIAGYLVSVPVNALTGWVDLFKYHNAGTSKAEKNPFLKASIKAQEDLDKALKSEFLDMGQWNYDDRKKAGITDLESFKNVMESFRKLNDEELIKVSESHENLVKRFLKVDPLYDKLIESRTEIHKALESGELLGTSKNLKAKGAGVTSSDGNDSLKTKNLSEFDYMYDFDWSLNKGQSLKDSKGNPYTFGFGERTSGMFSMGSMLGSTAENQQAYSDVSARLISGRESMKDVNSLGSNINNSILESLKTDQEQALADRIAFYENTTGIISNSENAIIGIHKAWSSEMLSEQIKGMQELTSSTSSILQNIGGITGNPLLQAGSGLIGGLGIGAAALGLGSTIAGFFESEPKTSIEDTSNVSSGIASNTSNSRTQIVSSAPENIYQTNTFSFSGCIVDEQTITKHVNEQIAPRLNAITKGVVA